jgi:hypothetical protein
MIHGWGLGPGGDLAEDFCWQAAITVGILLWVVGGLAPLLVPNALRGSTQRFIHIAEILTQVRRWA